MNRSQHYEVIQRALQGKFAEDKIYNILNVVEKAERGFESVFGETNLKEEKINRITGISVLELSDPDKSNDQNVISVSFKDREPIDSGPKPRKPIRCGGTICFVIFGVRICIDWESTNCSGRLSQ